MGVGCRRRRGRGGSGRRGVRLPRVPRTIRCRAELLRHDTDDDDDDDDDDYRRPRGQWVPDREEDDTPDAARLRAFLSRVLDELGLAASDPHHRGRRGAVAPRSPARTWASSSAAAARPSTPSSIWPASPCSRVRISRRRVELDAEGYKDRRRRQIERVALRKAEEAAKRGRPVQLTPMTPAERKIVHLTLRGRTDVAHGQPGPGAQPLLWSSRRPGRRAARKWPCLGGAPASASVLVARSARAGPRRHGGWQAHRAGHVGSDCCFVGSAACCRFMAGRPVFWHHLHSCLTI